MQESSGNYISTHFKALRTGKERKAFGVSVFTTPLKGNTMSDTNEFEDWLTEADDEAEEYQDGWDSLTAQLSEDEDWARTLYEAFHGQEV